MDLKEYLVDQNISVLEAMDVINKNAKGIVYVCDNDVLIGALTDGNIRRHILCGGSLNSKAVEVANLSPKFLLQDTFEDADFYMKKYNITSLPVLNNKKEVVSIKFLDNTSAFDYKQLNMPVVIMAGGKGTRLQPFTKVLPKPLIPIGDKTITERIMDCFKLFGCNEFNMIVNYKKNLIKSYFAELDNYNVEFTDEDTFLGTAGGLNLIKDKIDSTFFMINCDIIVDDNYYEILKHHKEKKAIATMVCTMQNYNIPYGTVDLNDDGNIKALREKPQLSYLVNTGMYILEPEFFDYIPENTFIHITDIIENCISDGKIVSMYPVSSNAWIDIGEMDKLEKIVNQF